MRDSGNANKLFRGTVIYAIGTFGTRILMFLIVPLYTYYLNPSEMGIYDVLISAISLLIPVISLQISDSVYRWVIRDVANNRIYIRVAYQYLLVGSAVSAVLIIMFSHIISIPHIVLFMCSLYSALFFQISQKILRGLKRQWLFAISGIIYTIIFLGLNIIQLCVLHKGVESLFISYITANIAGLLTIVLLEERIRVGVFTDPNLSVLKELLVYSIPLIPNYLSWWIVDSSDKYIVLFFLGLEYNGILAIAHKFPTILQSVFGLFLNSWQDLAVADEKREDGFNSVLFRKLYRFSFALIWVLIPLTKVVVWLVMGVDYKSACDYIPFYYLGSVFQVFSSFYGVGYLRRKNTKGAFTSSVYGAIINATVNLCLIKIIGLQAAAISTFIAFLVMWLIREKHNNTELEIRINWNEFCILVLSDIVICIISICGNIYFNVFVLPIGIITFMIFGEKDIKNIFNMIKTHNSS